LKKFQEEEKVPSSKARTEHHKEQPGIGNLIINN
jgi:hypothetical protein